VGIGGDPVVGSSFVDMLGLFERDEETLRVVLRPMRAIMFLQQRAKKEGLAPG